MAKVRERLAGNPEAKLPEVKEPGVELKGMSVPNLMRLRSQIMAALPPHELGKMNLEEELLLQYQLAKALMQTTHQDDGTPANQKAQVLNSCSAALDAVIKLQAKLYDAERVKMIEQCLESAFRDSPIEVKKTFFARYSQVLKEKSEKKQ